MLRILPLAFAAFAVATTPAVAQKRSPKDAAASFSLDPAALSGDAAPTPASTSPTDAAAPTTPDVPTPSAAAPASDAPIVTELGPAPSLDTPIQQLIANPRAKAVLDRDLPGLTTDDNLLRFQQLSLRRFQPMTGGQLTPALLAKVGADLAALDEKAETTFAPLATAKKGRRHDDDQGR